ncbi:hypothetical protein EPUS_02606 [Endocarpon pusillum Z07020]|uniref:SGF29 C-terminal domain-containing protein n=1 Tax=Endocarpon pusillum (strain Z07020 / HMAS-L-300199) TaxID=1263415 RepID=U1I0Y5_ENDPU|nr:uncharacterized protein EPUS_02606 [Endocarpon pusillum Z07020]ERF76895.1 hypothetical protein EPUS_02606 [Endocarpon pusillum Z07020]
MAPRLPPTKKGPQRTHQPPPSNIPAAAAGDVVAQPSTPVRNISDTPRRHTRRSERKVDVQTLPGTRWDKLEIERQRHRQREQESGSGITETPVLNELSLHEKTIHASIHRASATKTRDLVSETNPIEVSALQLGSQSLGSVKEANGRVLATTSSPIKKRRPNQSRLSKHRLSTGRQRQSKPEAGFTSQSPSSTLEAVIERDPLLSMARRPGRNQVDFVAELKETIHESLSKLSDIQDKLAPLGQQILVLEEELKAKEADNSVTLDDTKRLDELYRAKVKLTEQETGILHQPPDDLINKMGILNALAAREDTQAPGRGSAASKQRGSKRSAVESETAVVDSPGPSPSDVRSSDQLRRVKGQGQRSSSVASQTPRDGTSRLDDGPDGPRSGVADRAKMLVVHAEVAYRQSKATHDSDGERIHCTINAIRKDKGSGRTIYDIKDKDESENLLYTARAEDLLPIPPPGSQLPTFSPGKHIIALYPGTTTFYNAQVIGLFTKRDVYSLKFEGEENEKEVKEVERRYVLDIKTK